MRQGRLFMIQPPVSLQNVKARNCKNSPNVNVWHLFLVCVLKVIECDNRRVFIFLGVKLSFHSQPYRCIPSHVYINNQFIWNLDNHTQSPSGRQILNIVSKRQSKATRVSSMSVANISFCYWISFALFAFCDLQSATLKFEGIGYSSARVKTNVIIT